MPASIPLVLHVCAFHIIDRKSQDTSWGRCKTLQNHSVPNIDVHKTGSPGSRRHASILPCGPLVLRGPKKLPPACCNTTTCTFLFWCLYSPQVIMYVFHMFRILRRFIGRIDYYVYIGWTEVWSRAVTEGGIKTLMHILTPVWYSVFQT